MAILDQSYQPWNGPLQARPRRVGAMVRIGLRQAFAGTIIKFALLTTYGFMLAWVGVLFLLSSAQVPVPIAVGNNVFRHYLGAMLPMGIFVMLLAALVGSRSISRDLRSNALAMYFSKAITRGDYVAGKLGTVIGFLLLAVWGPAVLLWLGQWAVSRESLTTGQRLADLSALTLHSLALVVPIGSAVVALSTLSRNAIIPGILWVLAYLGSRGVSDILKLALQEEWCKLIAWDLLAARVGELCYERRPIIIAAVGRTIDPLPPSMSFGWTEPLLILAAITAGSIAFTCWRLRKFEERE